MDQPFSASLIDVYNRMFLAFVIRRHNKIFATSFLGPEEKVRWVTLYLFRMSDRQRMTKLVKDINPAEFFRHEDLIWTYNYDPAKMKHEINT